MCRTDTCREHARCDRKAVLSAGSGVGVRPLVDRFRSTAAVVLNVCNSTTSFSVGFFVDNLSTLFKT